MKTNLLYLVLLFLVFTLSACYKENQIAGQLEGNWEISELLWANANNVIGSDEKHSILFFPCEKAYTATCSGEYLIDFTDTVKTDLKATFKFDLKDDEMAIHTVSNTYIRRFIAQRFTLKNYKNGSLELSRIDFRKDSTQAILKAKKIK
jgi:hypothetical protein